MNFIRRRINRWLIGKEVKQAINDFWYVLQELRTVNNPMETCLYYATVTKTQNGLCYYFSMNYPKRFDVIAKLLKIERGGYMFYSQSVPTVGQAISLVSYLRHLDWREASIDLCQQRIEYLKKFI